MLEDFFNYLNIFIIGNRIQLKHKFELTYDLRKQN